MSSEAVAPVAVVIPVYNGEPYIAETIESVLRQTLPATEIVVVNDSSTDGTAEVVARYSPRVRLVTRNKGGVSAARNYGAYVTTAEWLAFLDHDDLWEPENLEHQMATILSAAARADFAYCDRRLLQADENGGFYYRDSKPMPPARDLPHVLMERCPFTPCSTLIRRDAFLGVGGFDGRHNSVEDWDLFLRLAANGARFVFTPERLAAYRVHGSSATRKGLRTLGVQLGVVEHSIAPRMTSLEKMTALRALKSRLESDAAVVMRETNEPGSLAMMLRSIIRHPFHTPHRYRIAAHMMLTRLKHAPSILQEPGRMKRSFRLLFSSSPSRYAGPL